jgi:Arc/MetJ-type ribon-helix-helix transcriptional regulator
MEEYVTGLVDAGGYAGSEEVVEEALREHQARRQGVEVVMTPQLEQLLDEGLEDLEHARATEELRLR